MMLGVEAEIQGYLKGPASVVYQTVSVFPPDNVGDFPQESVRGGKPHFPCTHGPAQLV